MTYTFSSGVLNNDTLGTTGVGTIHWLNVHLKDELIARHTYGLLSVLNETFNLDTILQEYRNENKILLQESEIRESEKRKAHLIERKAKVIEDPVLMKIITEVASSQQKIISEFNSGKEKALNAVIGMIIKRCKENNIMPDVFNITMLLKEHIKK